MSDECKDFITKLLEKDASKRLGALNDVEEVLAHPWLNQIDTKQILDKTLEAPMKPKVSDDPFDLSNFIDKCTKEQIVDSEIPEVMK